MGKIELKAVFDVNAILSQLNIRQLEEFLAAIAADLKKRKAKDPRVHEADLLHKLSEVCVLPEKSLQQFYELTEKKQVDSLSEREQQLLNKLIEEEEILRTQRVKLLGELAHLRGISLEQLMIDLGLVISDDD